MMCVRGGGWEWGVFFVVVVFFLYSFLDCANNRKWTIGPPITRKRKEARSVKTREEKKRRNSRLPFHRISCEFLILK